MHWATAWGHVDAVRILLESGAANGGMANVKDKEGWAPLHRNCQQPPPKEKPKDPKQVGAEAPKQDTQEKGMI